MSKKYLLVPMPTLETPRLTLRRLERTDCDDVYRYSSLSQTTRYLLWSPHLNLFETKGYLDYVKKKYRLGEFFDWGIEYKEKKMIVGTAGFTTLDFENNKGEIGYVLSPEFQHLGLASEAVDRVIRFGFESLGLERLEARIMEKNEASRHLVEKKGFKHEGTLRSYLHVKGEYKDICIYSMLAREYFKQTKHE